MTPFLTSVGPAFESYESRESSSRYDHNPSRWTASRAVGLSSNTELFDIHETFKKMKIVVTQKPELSRSRVFVICTPTVQKSSSSNTYLLKTCILNTAILILREFDSFSLANLSHSSNHCLSCIILKMGPRCSPKPWLISRSRCQWRWQLHKLQCLLAIMVFFNQSKNPRY
jgi:hypothetical protein